MSSCASNPSGSLNEDDSVEDSVDSKVPMAKDVADVFVQYSVLLDGDVMACRFCGDDSVTCGPNHFLSHLAGTVYAVEACEGVGEEVRKQVSDIFRAFRERRVIEKRKQRNQVDVESSRDHVFKRRRTASPDSEVEKSDDEIKKIFKEETCGAIARFFYKNAIPLDVVKSDEFKSMCDMVSRNGLGFEPPSFDDIKGKYGST